MIWQNAQCVVKTVQEAREIGRRLIVAKPKALVLGNIERGKQPFVQVAETAADKVIASGRRGGDADANFPIGMFKTPCVQFRAATGKRLARRFGIGRDDHEFARSIGDLRDRWELQRVEHLERGTFGKQRDLK